MRLPVLLVSAVLLTSTLTLTVRAVLSASALASLNANSSSNASAIAAASKNSLTVIDLANANVSNAVANVSKNFTHHALTKNVSIPLTTAEIIARIIADARYQAGLINAQALKAFKQAQVAKVVIN
jgi:hypothetical protein